MDDTVTQARAHAGPLDLPAWKSTLGAISAGLLALLFLVSGVWKIMEPLDTAQRMVQMKVPAQLDLLSAIGVGILEAWTGVLLIVPRFRRWGAWMAAFLLIVFMVYIGYHYKALTGEDCSCFPWLERVVGPGFFIGDGVMLIMAAIAGVWASRSHSKRGAAIALGAITVFAVASLGIAYARQSSAQAPASITADGKPYALREGKQYVYFFDPECSHCFQAAKAMAQYRWKNARVVVVPTINPQFAPGFLNDTGLRAPISPDIEALRKAFPFGDGPYAVALDNGRLVQAFPHFEGGEPETSLRKLGFIE